MISPIAIAQLDSAARCAYIKTPGGKETSFCAFCCDKMDLLSSVSVYVGKEQADIELEDYAHFQVEVPRVKDGNNDLVLTLKFNRRVYVRFSYQDKFIDLIGHTIQFSGFDGPDGEVLQFNLSQLQDIWKDLTESDRKRAVNQSKTLKVEIFKIKCYRDVAVQCKPRRVLYDIAGVSQVDGDIDDGYQVDGVFKPPTEAMNRDEVDGGVRTASFDCYQSDGGFKARTFANANKVVAYTNGQKSRVNYIKVNDEKGEHIETLLFTFVPEQPKKFVF